jgi:hypothetical protein
MSQNIGTLISAAIRPNDSNDLIASAWASEIKGGLHFADNISGRNSIIVQRREWGMLCYVKDTDLTYQLKYGYFNTTITDNNNWSIFSDSGTSEWLNSVKSIRNDQPISPVLGDRYILGTSPTGTNWSTFNVGDVVEWSGASWVVSPNPIGNGTSVRVDDQDDSIYRYQGLYPSGTWENTSNGYIQLNNSETISFTQSGLSASSFVNLGSLTASHLNTGLNGGATSGYILSNTEDGNFAWIEPSTSVNNLSVSDYDKGTTFSNIENIIFRGGLVSTPGGTAMGVLAGAPTSSNTVTVWIPAPPQAVYASHFNTTDGNTTGTSNRTLSTATVRISTPTSEGTPFETGGWAGTNQVGTTDTTPIFSTSGLVTGFSGTSSGDSKIIVDVYRANGTATFSTYTTPVLYQNGTHTDSAGISVTIGSYAVDNSGFPSIYVTKYKATINVSVNMDTIFTSNGLQGGRYHIEIKHITDTLTDGGNTYTYTSSDVFYDTNPNTPSIGGSTTIIESTTPGNIITKHISGVEYYTTGSQFELTTTGINNLNKNTQGWPSGVNDRTSKNFTITAPNYNLPTTSLQSWSPSVGTFIGWLNNYDNTGVTYSYTNWTIPSSSTFRYRGDGAIATSQDFDPWGSSSVNNSSANSVLIDQVSDNSTRLGESFNGENERLIRGLSSYTTWDSSTTLGTSLSNQTGTGPFCDACVVGGYLVRPDKYWLSSGLTTIQPDLTTYKPDKNGLNPDYSGVGYQTKSTYHRRFYTTSALNIPSFIMTFSGTFGSYTDANSALLASQLKVYIRRISSPSGDYGHSANPLALHGGLYNSGSPGTPFDDGIGGVDSLGSLIRTGVGANNNIINGTFGGYPANTGFWMELQIVDPSIKIDYINVTLTFSNSTTDSVPVT